MNIYTPLISVDDRVVTASRIQSGKESFRGLSPEQVAAVEAGETVCIRCNNGPRAIVEVFDGFATRTFEGSIASVPNLGRLDTDAEKMAALEVWAAGKQFPAATIPRPAVELVFQFLEPIWPTYQESKQPLTMWLACLRKRFSLGLRASACLAPVCASRARSSCTSTPCMTRRATTPGQVAPR